MGSCLLEAAMTCDHWPGQSDPRVDVVCFGETMALLAPDPPRPLSEATTLRLSHGGAESNVAVSLTRLGSTAQWCSRLGADALGQRLLADMRLVGVDTDLVVCDPNGRTGLYLKDPGNGSTRVWYYRDGSAATLMDDSDVDRALAGRPRLLHISGVTPALSSSCASAVSYALDRASNLGVETSFDVNYRRALWPDRATAAATLLAIAQRSDIVFVGLDEATALWDQTTEQQVRELLAVPRVLVVKDGPRRASSFEHGNAVHVAAPPAVVVEVVGAGDAFAAGWLHGYLIGMDATERLRLGHLVAGISLSSATDHGQFPADARELEEMARNHNADGSSWAPANCEERS